MTVYTAKAKGPKPGDGTAELQSERLRDLLDFVQMFSARPGWTTTITSKEVPS